MQHGMTPGITVGHAIGAPLDLCNLPDNNEASQRLVPDYAGRTTTKPLKATMEPPREFGQTTSATHTRGHEVPRLHVFPQDASPPKVWGVQLLSGGWSVCLGDCLAVCRRGE